MALRKLERVLEDYKDDMKISRLPNTEEIMNKINEVIEYVNHIEKAKADKPIKSLY